MFARIVLTSFCAMLMTGCADKRGGIVAYSPPNFSQPDSATVARPDDNTVGPFDEISVTVFQLPEINRDAAIDANGNINLPLLGPIHAQGKTTQQLKQEITAQLAAKYVRNPDVDVSIKQSSAETITVEGSVQNPGVFPISGETTLIKAVALARGTSEGANPRRVVVFRKINGKRNAAAFDLQSIRRAEADDPLIFGNDIIVVDGSSSKSRFKTIVQTLPLIALFHPF